METKGKCFSMTDQGQRNENDLYQTSYSLTWELYYKYKDIITNNKKILEPCCGHNAIIDGLAHKGIMNVIGKDLITTGHDFYQETEKYDLIITNPSFKNTHLFIEKCMELTNEFFLLIPIAHLQGNERYKSQTYKWLKEISIFTRMVAFEHDIRNDGKFNTGMMPTAWYHFKNDGNITPPIVSWIDIQKYVLTSDIMLKELEELKSLDEGYLFDNTKCISKKKIESFVNKRLKETK